MLLCLMHMFNNQAIEKHMGMTALFCLCGLRLRQWLDQELKKEPVDYWLLANSYSPLWGMHGLFKMRRGQNECGIESTPAAGTPDLDTLFPVKAEES